MTPNQSDGLVAVIQLDREAAAEAAQTIYYANSDVLCEADVEEMRDVLAEALARHREASVAELVEALRFYANPEIYKPHPHGPGFDDRDLSFRAIAALSKAGVGQ